MINIEEVGNRIAECRKKLNITQTELAEKLLVSSKTISKWEKGHGLPNIEILPEIAEIFGITIDYLLLGKKSLDNKISIVKNSGEFGITKLIFPDINDFPKELQHPILTHFLGEYAKLNNIDFGEMLESIHDLARPKGEEAIIDKILSLDKIGIAILQRALYIGFSKAAYIRDSFIEKKLIEDNKFGPCNWINKDKNLIKEIIDIVYKK